MLLLRKKKDDDDFLFVSPKSKTSERTFSLSDDDVYPGLKKRKTETNHIVLTPNAHHSPSSNENKDKKFNFLTDNLFSSEKKPKHKDRRESNENNFHFVLPSRRPNSPYAHSIFAAPHNNYYQHQPYHPYMKPKSIKVNEETPPILTQIIKSPTIIKLAPSFTNATIENKRNETEKADKTEKVESYGLTLEKEKEIIDKKLKEKINSLSKLDGYDFISNPKKINNQPSQEKLVKKITKLNELNTVLQEGKYTNLK